MTTDGIQHVGGEADLIDGALRGSRSKEDGYRADEEEQEELKGTDLHDQLRLWKSATCGRREKCNTPLTF